MHLSKKGELETNAYFDNFLKNLWRNPAFGASLIFTVRVGIFKGSRGFLNLPPLRSRRCRLTRFPVPAVTVG